VCVCSGAVLFLLQSPDNRSLLSIASTPAETPIPLRHKTRLLVRYDTTEPLLLQKARLRAASCSGQELKVFEERRNFNKTIICLALRPLLTLDTTRHQHNRIIEDEAAHELYMKRAIILAKNSRLQPFGALLVDDSGVVVGEGWNRASINPVLHGEIDAINNCATKHPAIDWERLTLFTTAEPCAMCQAAVAWTGISGVVYGSSIPFLRGLGWRTIEIRAEDMAERVRFRQCVIKGGVLELECNGLFKDAISRQTIVVPH